jgi:hypothetical protein
MTSVDILHSDIAELTRVNTEASVALHCKLLIAAL